MSDILTTEEKKEFKTPRVKVRKSKSLITNTVEEESDTIENTESVVADGEEKSLSEVFTESQIWKLKTKQKPIFSVHSVESLDEEKYKEFTAEKYPYSLNFYDCEVFKHDWCITVINPIEKVKNVFVNKPEEFKNYYREHIEQIWVGYNSRQYDTNIVKGLLNGLNPKVVNDMLIVEHRKGFEICRDFANTQLYDFDLYTRGIGRLKTLEAYMGNDIEETEVDFNMDRALNEEEIESTIKYNTYDVEQTIEVFKINKSDYDSKINLIETFNLPTKDISKTSAQLTSEILGCIPQERNDEFNLTIVDTLRLNKYAFIKEWFENPDNLNYSSNLNVDICGIPHQIGWGGLHGAIDHPVKFEGKIFHADVNSYYPSIMIVYDMLTRNCQDKNKYKEIYETRLALKRAGKKKEQVPYKLVLNSTYGVCKDKYNKAYDPKRANDVCVNGQLMLVDLLEHLEPYITLIQSNTDGIIFKVDDEKNEEIALNICKEWESRTGMGLAVDYLNLIIQKDVNNYVVEFTPDQDKVNGLLNILKEKCNNVKLVNGCKIMTSSRLTQTIKNNIDNYCNENNLNYSYMNNGVYIHGKLEKKGAYVKDLSKLDYDLPIVNKALVDYMLYGISISKTIGDCDDLLEFQKIFKRSNKYLYTWHNGKIQNDNIFRVFASKNKNDTFLGKIKEENGTIEKYGNSPDHCFINNGIINGVKVPKELDKKWYINIAVDRLSDYGIRVFSFGM